MTTSERNKIYASADYKGLSEAEKAIYKSVVTDLTSRDMFRITDLPVIAAYSRNVVLARLAAADIQKYGTVLEEEDKYHGVKLKENPAVQIMQRAQKQYEESAIRLGMTPTGRKRLRGEEKGQKSALERFREELDD